MSEWSCFTLRIQDWNARNVALHQRVNDIHDRRIHRGSGKIMVGSNVQVAQWFSEILRLPNIDGDEFEDSILRDDADDHVALSLIVGVNNRDTASARDDHAAAGLIEWL